MPFVKRSLVILYLPHQHSEGEHFMRVVLFALASALLATPAVAATYVDQGTVITAGNGSGSYGPGTGGAGVFNLFSITGRDDTGYALGGTTGTPGQVVVSFSGGMVFDGAGIDFITYDNFGLSEGLQVEGSLDGVAYTLIGNVGAQFATLCSPGSPCASGFDLAGTGLASAKYFRLTAVQDACVSAFPECYDLDTLEAVNFAGGAVPEPASWAMLIAGFGIAGGQMRRRRTVRASYA